MKKRFVPSRLGTASLAALLALAGPALSQDPKPAAPAAKPAEKASGGAKAKVVEAKPAAAAVSALETDDEKAFYALGLYLSRNVSIFSLTKAELAVVQQGLADGVLGNPPKVELEKQFPKLNDLARARQQAAAEVEKKAGAAFLESAASEAGAIKKTSGLVYKELTPGTGASPKPTDRVKVHYHGTLTDGTVFDSSVQRGQPVDFALNGVVPCWVEGFQLMKVGGKSRFVCPSSIAYGDAGSPPKIKPGATLVFEVELLEIAAPPPTHAPPVEMAPPVSAPPADAKKPEAKKPETKKPEAKK